MKPAINKLLVVSHVCHYKHAGKIYAYGPYTREIDIWADLFPHILIASPCRNETPPNDCLAFTRPNISMVPQLETGGDTLFAKFVQLLLLPILIWKLAQAMSGADAIHVRCPGNLGLLGVIIAPLFRVPLVAKYAGQWNGYHHEPFAVWLQRFILRSKWWANGVVTVYGEWPNQPEQITPFFTSMMTSAQVQRALKIARNKRMVAPIEILFSGRLAAVKGVDVLLQALHLLDAEGLQFRLSIIGDGPEATRLKQLTSQLGLGDKVRFIGAVPFQEVMTWYEKGQILVLPSKHSEGWPKVLAEAMCHGLVCVSTDHGLVPWLLSGRGCVFPVDDVTALASQLGNLMRNPEEYSQLSYAAATWAGQYSLDGLRDALQKLLSSRWQLPVPASLSETSLRES